ncbi:hypothetical protein HMPREF9080_00868 [Cardiobacterium valvarum F0432]|uniref:Uncharacterized protein n=1 Tax=Cardiobacterium valvarum F0432 TaxID=797473 RepID=G9ZDN4_9GAMM|nr:hypothetical protein HMPREF9080_00868 [Cardiobacterium valvarum F0432]
MLDSCVRVGFSPPSRKKKYFCGGLKLALRFGLPPSGINTALARRRSCWICEAVQATSLHFPSSVVPPCPLPQTAQPRRLAQYRYCIFGKRHEVVVCAGGSEEITQIDFTVKHRPLKEIGEGGGEQAGAVVRRDFPYAVVFGVEEEGAVAVRGMAEGKRGFVAQVFGLLPLRPVVLIVGGADDGLFFFDGAQRPQAVGPGVFQRALALAEGVVGVNSRITRRHVGTIAVRQVVGVEVHQDALVI